MITTINTRELKSSSADKNGIVTPVVTMRSPGANHTYVNFRVLRSGETWQVPSLPKRHQVILAINGRGGVFRFKKLLHKCQPGSTGLYLEPKQSALFEAKEDDLALLYIAPKALPGEVLDSPAGYAFDFEDLEELCSQDHDGNVNRRRRFAVNVGTKLSQSRSLQFGLMRYEANASSPLHWHLPTTDVQPEHFYFILAGGGAKVRTQEGELSAEPGTLVWIPSGERHQLVSSEEGLLYLEYQGPNLFKTHFEPDPNMTAEEQARDLRWYLPNGQVWVQS